LREFITSTVVGGFFVARLPGGAMRVISRERVHILDISFTQAIR